MLGRILFTVGYILGAIVGNIDLRGAGFAITLFCDASALVKFLF
jgi:hypothetical protein